MLLRGENRRMMELADLASFFYSEKEGPTLCCCLVLAMTRHKTNHDGHKDLMGVMRHKDPLLCAQGALAMLLFFRWHIQKEEPPNFFSRKLWYDIKVLTGQGRAPKDELSYDAQLDETWAAFQEAGIVSRMKTHAPRAQGAQMAETLGTSFDQISKAGRWNNTMLCKAYLTHLPRHFMRSVAGFNGDGTGDYFIRRAVYEPPQSIQQQLWPWLDHWQTRFELRAQGLNYQQGGLNHDDLAAVGFLKLLRWLRIVLPQDLAVLQPSFPSLPFYRHAPFYGDVWDAYALKVRSQAEEADPAGFELRRWQPQLVNFLQNQLDSVRQSIAGVHLQVKDLSSYAHGFADVFNGKAPVQFHGYFTRPEAAASSQPKAYAVTAEAALALAPEAEAAAAPASQAKTDEAADNDVPIYQSLGRAESVADVWRQWKQGYPGQPPIQELERKYGSRWRPGTAIRTQFCRWRNIWDTIEDQLKRGRAEDEAIAALELRRGRMRLRKFTIELAKERKERERARG